jgi:Bacteriocin-protection, YdeI or OmpD-Associated
MTFTATAQARPRGGIAIALPFDPAEAWGDRDRYYLAGTIERYSMRATVTPAGAEPMLMLGPAWCRDPRVGPGASLQVSLHPEGPQLDTISPDFADALRAEPEARRFFESLATFYRKAYVTWVEGAKKQETRVPRIAEVVDDLKAGRRERSAAAAP